MNLEGDKKERKIYDDETEDDDDDTRSIISTDSEASKNTITTDNSDTYIEDFDNKSEKDVTDDKLEDITNDNLFNIYDETVEPDESDIDDVIDNSTEDEPETQEISDNSSLLIQYDLDNNGELSIPYGIYKECHKTEDGNSFCKQTELTNDTVDEIVNENDNEKTDKDDAEIVKDDVEIAKDDVDIAKDDVEEETKKEEVNELFDEIINDIKKNNTEEERSKEYIADKYEPMVKKKSKGTKKKSNKHKRFDYTKKKSIIKHRMSDGSKKKGSRNKKRNVAGKNTRKR